MSVSGRGNVAGPYRRAVIDCLRVRADGRGPRKLEPMVEGREVPAVGFLI